MTQFILVGPPRQPNPAAVEVLCLGTHPNFDQHLCCFDVRCLDRDAIIHRANACEHFSTDFPGVMPAAPRVKMFGAGQIAAGFIHEFAVHVGTVQNDGTKLKAWRGV